MSEKPTFLSFNEAARFLDVAPATLYGWYRSSAPSALTDPPPRVRIGGRWRYIPEDLERWVHENRNGVKS